MRIEKVDLTSLPPDHPLFNQIAAELARINPDAQRKTVEEVAAAYRHQVPGKFINVAKPVMRQLPGQFYPDAKSRHKNRKMLERLERKLATPGYKPSASELKKLMKLHQRHEGR